MSIDTLSLLTGAHQALTPGHSKAIATPPVPAISAPSATELEQVAQQIQSQLQAAGISVDVSVDSKSDLRVVTIRDSANGSVIRQFPSEQAIWLTQHLNEGSALLRETA
jgi:uncharacterized FlaG/YvyC family protein